MFVYVYVCFCVSVCMCIGELSMCKCMLPFRIHRLMSCVSVSVGCMCVYVSVHLCGGQRLTCYVDDDGLELLIPLPPFLSAGIAGMYQQARFMQQ